MKENAFLDKIGLSHLIDKLQSLFAYKNHSHSPLNFTGATYESYDGSTSKSIHIPSYSVMQGATENYNGSSGLVPAPNRGEQNLFLKGDGTYDSPPNTTYGTATEYNDGLMSSSDKSKLNSIAYNANNYTHPSYYSKTSGLYKITVDSLGHVSAATSVTKSDITALGIPSQDTNTWTPLQGSTSYYDGSAGYAPAPKAGSANRYLRCDGVWEVPPDTNTTYSLASYYTDGLMSSSDKNKLDGISSGANYYTHPTYSSKYSGLYKITVDSTGHVSAATTVTKSDITALGIPGQDTNTTYGLSSYYSDGLMRSLNNNTSQFMRGDGNWSDVPTSTSGKYTASQGFTCGSVTDNFKNKVLWAGALWPSSEHTLSLSEYVTDQPHGIVLVFSVYENGAAADWGFSTFFVPKEYVNKHSGKGMDFPMGTTTFGVCANKYLYVGNSAIRGNDTNKMSGTGASGIKYENGYYVLRYVLGV